MKKKKVIKKTEAIGESAVLVCTAHRGVGFMGLASDGPLGTGTGTGMGTGPGPGTGTGDVVRRRRKTK